MEERERYEIEHKAYLDGAKFTRDSIIAMLIGMQNDWGFFDSVECQAYQKVINLVEQTHGEYSTPIKGV